MSKQVVHDGCVYVISPLDDGIKLSPVLGSNRRARTYRLVNLRWASLRSQLPEHVLVELYEGGYASGLRVLGTVYFDAGFGGDGPLVLSRDGAFARTNTDVHAV